jgi:hypothetical protein
MGMAINLAEARRRAIARRIAVLFKNSNKQRRCLQEHEESRASRLAKARLHEHKCRRILDNR